MASMASQASSVPDRDHPVIAFDGAIYTQTIHEAHRAFAAEITFKLQHPQLLKIGSQKPPLHFHPYQREYIKVLEGRLCVELDGIEHTVRPEDGEVCVKPWTHHRLYPPPNDGSEVTRFYLSGAETEEAFQLDNLFFSNWYGYQDDVFVRGRPLSVIQVMAMFDAGGSYLSLPRWVPYGRTIARVMGIVVGRWIGAMLGYQPYYRKWSVDWSLACERMGNSFFQRRFAIRPKPS